MNPINLFWIQLNWTEYTWTNLYRYIHLSSYTLSFIHAYTPRHTPQPPTHPSRARANTGKGTSTRARVALTHKGEGWRRDGYRLCSDGVRGVEEIEGGVCLRRGSLAWSVKRGGGQRAAYAQRRGWAGEGVSTPDRIARLRVLYNDPGCPFR